MSDSNLSIAEARRIINDPSTTLAGGSIFAAAKLMESCENPEVTLDDMLRCLDYRGVIAEMGARCLYVRTGRDGLGRANAGSNGLYFVTGRADWESYLWKRSLLERQPLELAEIVHSRPLSGEFEEVSFGSDHGNTLWLKFSSQTDASEWIGKFGCGSSSVLRVTRAAQPDKFLISAGGFGYVVDATRRALLVHHFDDLARDILYHPQSNFFIVADFVRIRLIFNGKVWWSSPRIALDGIRNICLDGDTVRGLAVTGFEGQEEEFTVDLKTGKVTCATDYSGWDDSPPTAQRKKPSKPWWKFWNK